MESVHRFRLSNGVEVTVRRETPNDVPALVALFEHVSPQSRLDRAGYRPAQADHATAVREATRMAEIDRTGTVAWLAFVDTPEQAGAPVAAARYAPNESGIADLTVVVRDDMQGQGIGSRLLYYALEQARANGIGEARTSFENSNEAAWQVLQYSPYHITWQPCGSEVEVMIHLQARTQPGVSLN